MSIDTTFLRRCIASLERAVEGIEQLDNRGDVLYDIFRAACVKEFELVLEQSGNFLRKCLAAYFSSNRQADQLNFKDLFRHAARHGLIALDAVERWLEYRDHRNDTAHYYGEDFAEATLLLLPGFIQDVKSLANMLEQSDDGLLDDIENAGETTAKLQLSPCHRGVLEALLQEHMPDVEAWVYGSRVNGRSHDGSDLDLALRAPGLKKIPVKQLADFMDALCESSIPFLVEARDWARQPERFQREIERDYVNLASDTKCSVLDDIQTAEKRQQNS